MHIENIADWQHEHSFGQDQRRPGESRTLWVIALTAIMMVVEIGAGIMYGSMALLADGLHMASHAAALTISAFAYVYARRHAHDNRFSFGTGKVNSLGGFSGALLLAVFALMMAWESCGRLLNPVPIAYNQAILVAILGLVVNGASVFILGVHDHGHDDESGHAHSHAHAHSHSHSPGTHDHDGGHHHDHNLRAAYLHVMADALTSVLAIFALLLAKYKGLNWMDPVMGIVGAVLISKWSLGLLRTTSRVLLDRQVDPKTLEAVRSCVEDDSDNKVADLHVWSIGPGIFAAEISLVTHHPQAPDHYRHLLRSQPEIVHANFEVHQCHDAEHGCKAQHDHAH